MSYVHKITNECMGFYDEYIIFIIIVVVIVVPIFILLLCRRRHIVKISLSHRIVVHVSLAKTHSRRMLSFFHLPFSSTHVFDKIMRRLVIDFRGEKISLYTQNRPSQLYLFGQMKFDHVFYAQSFY